MTDAQPVKNPPPENPRKNDTWMDDDNELHTWNGKEWVPFEDVPFFNPNSPFRDR
jgi:hypothetical protein